MDFNEVMSTVFIGLGIFLVVRVFLIYFVSRKIQQKIVVDQYADILNSPQYQVKGKFE